MICKSTLLEALKFCRFALPRLVQYCYGTHCLQEPLKAKRKPKKRCKLRPLHNVSDSLSHMVHLALVLPCNITTKQVVQPTACLGSFIVGMNNRNEVGAANDSCSNMHPSFPASIETGGNGPHQHQGAAIHNMHAVSPRPLYVYLSTTIGRPFEAKERLVASPPLNRTECAVCGEQVLLEYKMLHWALNSLQVCSSLASLLWWAAVGFLSCCRTHYSTCGGTASCCAETMQRMPQRPPSTGPHR